MLLAKLFHHLVSKLGLDTILVLSGSCGVYVWLGSDGMMVMETTPFFPTSWAISPPPSVFLLFYFQLLFFPSLSETSWAALCGCTDEIHLSCNHIVNLGPMRKPQGSGFSRENSLLSTKLSSKQMHSIYTSES